MGIHLSIAFSERNTLVYMFQVIQVLLGRGADLDALNNRNETSLDVLKRMKEIRRGYYSEFQMPYELMC